MEIVIQDSVVYQRHRFNLERELEEVVFANHQSLFGSQTIFFEKRKIRTSTGVGTIPDGFVIDPKNEKWYVIEVELAQHHAYNHILPQLLKFKKALDTQTTTRRDLQNLFDKDIEADLFKRATWIKATGDPEIHRRLTKIIHTEPEVIVIIDNPNLDLLDAVTQLAFKTRIHVFKTYCREGCGLISAIHQFETLEPVQVNLPVAVQSKNVVVSVTVQTNPTSLVTSELDNVVISPTEWAKQIPEIIHINTIRTWKDICLQLNLQVKGDSARRVLKKWVAGSRPNWPPVPDA